MATYKTIRIPKRGGGTRSQRVQVLASGKYKFVKNPTKSKTSSKNKRKTTSKGGKIRKMARKYKMTIPLAPVIGLAAGMIDPVLSLLSGDFKKAVDHMAVRYAGYSTERKQVEIAGLKEGLLPLIIGLVVHKFVGGSLGLNRLLGRAKVPLLRL